MKQIPSPDELFDDPEPRAERDDDPDEISPTIDDSDRAADRYEESLDRQAELREFVLWRAP